MRGAAGEVLHVEGLACGLLCTLPFYTFAIRAFRRQQDTILSIGRSPAELTSLEDNGADIFPEPGLMHAVERYQCHGVLALYRLPACFLEHVQSKTRHRYLEAHAMGFPSYLYQCGFIAIFSAMRERMIWNASASGS